MVPGSTDILLLVFFAVVEIVGYMDISLVDPGEVDRADSSAIECALAASRSRLSRICDPGPSSMIVLIPPDPEPEPEPVSPRIPTPTPLDPPPIPVPSNSASNLNLSLLGAC